MMPGWNVPHQLIWFTTLTCPGRAIRALNCAAVLTLPPPVANTVTFPALVSLTGHATSSGPSLVWSTLEALARMASAVALSRLAVVKREIRMQECAMASLSEERPLKSPRRKSESPTFEVLMTFQLLVPPEETRHFPPEAVNTSVLPSPSKSPKRRFESATLEVLRTCQSPVPLYDTSHFPPELVNTSALQLPSKSPKRRSESATFEVLMTCQVPAPPYDTRHFPPEAENTSSPEYTSPDTLPVDTKPKNKAPRQA